VDQNCPFCSPKFEDVIVLENSVARALVDARPILVGHTIVASREHKPSALDLDALSYAGLRLLQEEISFRIHRATGEVGVYEHGRSALCRPFASDRGHVHAHLHVFPAAFDLLRQVHCKILPVYRPLAEDLSDDRRYLYQEIGSIPRPEWGVPSRDPSRHVVRSVAEAALLQNGRSWVAMDAPSSVHEQITEESKELINSYRPIVISEIRIAGRDKEIEEAVAQDLRLQSRIPVITRSNSTTHAYSSTQLRIFLCDERSYETEVLSWTDFRIPISGLGMSDIKSLVRDSLRMRLDREG
jgi:diadenosine tetraphosphate (Ap4A) HIT family hydrolase